MSFLENFTVQINFSIFKKVFMVVKSYSLFWRDFLMDGILPLYKERGMTSNDAVIKCRKIFKTRKIGHSGTLDPEVDGVLPICVGKF